MDFSWGIDKLVIDHMEFFVKQGFIESEHRISGKMGNLVIDIDIRNPSNLLLLADSGYILIIIRSQVPNTFKYNNNMKALLPGEVYCLNLFVYIFVISVCGLSETFNFTNIS